MVAGYMAQRECIPMQLVFLKAMFDAAIGCVLRWVIAGAPAINMIETQAIEKTLSCFLPKRLAVLQRGATRCFDGEPAWRPPVYGEGTNVVPVEKFFFNHV